MPGIETWAPVLDERREVAVASVSGLEITERQRAEQALRNSEARPRRFLARTLVFIGTLTPDGILNEANAPAIAAAGVEREDVIGNSFWECYWWGHSPAGQHRLREAVAQAAARETVRYDAEVRVGRRRRPGDTRGRSCRAGPDISTRA